MILEKLIESSALLPEGILTLAALGILLVARLWRDPRVVAALTLGALAAAAISLSLLLGQLSGPAELFSSMVVRSGMVGVFQIGVLAAVALTVLMALGDRNLNEMAVPEFFGLLLMASVGLLLLAGAQNLVMFYVGLELVSLPSYLLCAFLRKDKRSSEGGLKYFLFGTLATGMMLYGISWIYGATGTLDLQQLSFLLVARNPMHFPLLLVGLLLLIVGFGFKIALVPFHQWAPDAYEAAPTPIAAFISTAPKIAGFAILIRVFSTAFYGLTNEWVVILQVLSILTMTLGNVTALWQTNLKRLLAYSSIAHAGTILIGVVAATDFGTRAVAYYVLSYALMNLAAFGCVIAVANKTGREDIEGFKGLGQTHPILAATFAITLLSLAGIPPMAGFVAKVWVFAAALRTQLFGLAVVAALNSAIAAFYYMRIIREMYLRDPETTKEVTLIPLSLKATLATALGGILLLGLWPTPILQWIVSAFS